jgi:hypothetical protein
VAACNKRARLSENADQSRTPLKGLENKGTMTNESPKFVLWLWRICDVTASNKVGMKPGNPPGAKKVVEGEIEEKKAAAAAHEKENGRSITITKLVITMFRSRSLDIVILYNFNTPSYKKASHLQLISRMRLNSFLHCSTLHIFPLHCRLPISISIHI